MRRNAGPYTRDPHHHRLAVVTGGERVYIWTPEVGLCRLTRGCPWVHSAWSQRLKLKHDILLSNVAFTFSLRRYTEGASFVQIPLPDFRALSVAWSPAGGELVLVGKDCFCAAYLGS